MSRIRQNLPRILKSFEDYDVFVENYFDEEKSKNHFYLRTEHDPSVGIFGQDVTPVFDTINELEFFVTWHKSELERALMEDDGQMLENFVNKYQTKGAKMDLKTRIITALLKEAMPMLTLDPTTTEMKWILKALKDYYGLETASSKVVWKQYVTFREGSSNKFHFFVVFETADKKYVAANAYGRIGYPAKIFDLGSFRDQYEALDVAKRKLHSKLNKGYEVTEVA